LRFRNPELLENVAWLSLVKEMKKLKTVKDPYEVARKYLPCNSAINCPFERSDKDDLFPKYPEKTEHSIDFTNAQHFLDKIQANSRFAAVKNSQFLGLLFVIVFCCVGTIYYLLNE
jgi:hypothetical protein